MRLRIFEWDYGSKGCGVLPYKSVLFGEFCFSSFPKVLLILQGAIAASLRSLVSSLFLSVFLLLLRQHC